MLDVAGQDATEAFEDVGHSDEAREVLDGLLVGTLKRMVCFSIHTLPMPLCLAWILTGIFSLEIPPHTRQVIHQNPELRVQQGS